MCTLALEYNTFVFAQPTLKRLQRTISSILRVIDKMMIIKGKTRQTTIQGLRDKTWRAILKLASSKLPTVKRTAKDVVAVASFALHSSSSYSRALLWPHTFIWWMVGKDLKKEPPEFRNSPLMLLIKLQMLSNLIRLTQTKIGNGVQPAVIRPPLPGR